MKAGIVVIAELERGAVAPVTYELIALARMLPPRDCAGIHVIALGSEESRAAEEIAERAGVTVTGVENDHCREYHPEVFLSVLRELLPEFDARFIIAAGGSRGSDLAPALAPHLGARCISGVTGCRVTEAGIFFSRDVFGGKLVMEIRAGDGRCIITAQQGSFKEDKRNEPLAGEVRIVTNPYAPSRMKSLGSVAPVEEGTPITEAEVIVAAGRGIGAPENLDLIERLSALFVRSAVGGSRIVCDLGWLSYQRQIGITGKTVAPQLYIACGISGAAQHIAGMKNSRLIVAINRDPSASIFSVADYCVIEDLKSFIPLLIEEYEKT